MVSNAAGQGDRSPFPNSRISQGTSYNTRSRGSGWKPRSVERHLEECWGPGRDPGRRPRGCLPARPVGGWRARVRAVEVVEGHLGCVLLGVVEVLAVIPKPGCDDLARYRHPAGPSSPAACVRGPGQLPCPPRTVGRLTLRGRRRNLPRLSETTWKTGG